MHKLSKNLLLLCLMCCFSCQEQKLETELIEPSKTPPDFYEIVNESNLRVKREENRKKGEEEKKRRQQGAERKKELLEIENSRAKERNRSIVEKDRGRLDFFLSTLKFRQEAYYSKQELSRFWKMMIKKRLCMWEVIFKEHDEKRMREVLKKKKEMNYTDCRRCLYENIYFTPEKYKQFLLFAFGESKEITNFVFSKLKSNKPTRIDDRAFSYAQTERDVAIRLIELRADLFWLNYNGKNRTVLDGIDEWHKNRLAGEIRGTPHMEISMLTNIFREQKSIDELNLYMNSVEKVMPDFIMKSN